MIRHAAATLMLALSALGSAAGAAEPSRVELSPDLRVADEATPELSSAVGALAPDDMVEVIVPGAAEQLASVERVIRAAEPLEQRGGRVRVPVDGGVVEVAPVAFARIWLREHQAGAGDRFLHPRAAPLPPMQARGLFATQEVVEPGQDASPAAYHVLLVARRGAADKVDAAGRVICSLGAPSSVAEPERRAIMAVPVVDSRQVPLSAAYDFDRVANWNGLLAALGVPIEDSDVFGFLALEDATSPVQTLDRGILGAFRAARPIFVDLSDISIHYVESVTEAVVKGMAKGQADGHLALLGLITAVSQVHLLGEALVAIVGSDPAVAGEPSLPPC